MDVKNCIICNKPINKSKYSNGHLCSLECFQQHHWLKTLECIHRSNEFDTYADYQKMLQQSGNNSKNSQTKFYIVIDQNVYAIPAKNNSKYDTFQGFGGRVFKIKLLKSDEIITTNNLWAIGTLPEKYTNTTPNTAIFI